MPGSGVRTSIQRRFPTLNSLRGEPPSKPPPFILVRQGMWLGIMGKKRPVSGPAIRSHWHALPPPPRARAAPSSMDFTPGHRKKNVGDAAPLLATAEAGRLDAALP